MNKILNKIIYYLPEIFLSMVIMESIIPFTNYPVDKNHSYIFLGGFYSFFSYLSFYIFKPKRNSSAYYNILLLIYVILFFIAMYIIGNKNSNYKYSNIELFLLPYYGSIFGLILAGLIENKINKKNKND